MEGVISVTESIIDELLSWDIQGNHKGGGSGVN